MRILIKLCILLPFIFTLKGQEPVPDNYTIQKAIDFMSQDLIYNIKYSPDETSVLFKSAKGYIFRQNLLDRVQEITIPLINITNYAYNSQADRLYFTAKGGPNFIYLFWYRIKQGFIIADSNTCMGKIIDNDYYSLPIKIVISPTKIALFNQKKFYVLNVTNQQDGQLLRSQVINPGKMLMDVKWHPYFPDLLFIACKSRPNGDGWLSFYNITSKQFIQLNNFNTTFIGFSRQGYIVMQQIQKDQQTQQPALILHTFDGVNLNKINQINYFSLLEDSVSKDGQVFAGVTYFLEPGTLKVYQFVYTNYQISKKEHLFKQNNHQNFDIFNHKNKGLTVDYKTILSESYPRKDAFSGISPNGNQIYVKTDDNDYIQGNVSRMRRCTDGTFLKDGFCYKCSSDCKTCFSAEELCTSCTNPQQFGKYSCIGCSKRFTGCETCTVEFCAQCNQTAQFDPMPKNGQCFCKNNTYLTEDKSQCLYCRQAMLGCNKCNSTTFCTQCIEQNHFESDNNGGCKCVYNFVHLQEYQNCIQCATAYWACLDCKDTGKCVECNSTAFYEVSQDGKCKCISGYVEKYQVCIQCSIMVGCIDCKNTTECLACNKTGNFESDGGGKCKCIEGYKLINNKCLKCEDILGCLACSDVDVCTVCNETANFLLVNGKCQCIQKYWLNVKQCQLCSNTIQNCEICSSDGKKCSKCLNQDKKPNQNQTKCICEDFKYEDQNKLCQFCDPYQNCIQCIDSMNCSKCDTSKGWQQNAQNGKCTCGTQYFEYNNTCYLCSLPGCIECSGQNYCSKCISQSNFNPDPVEGSCHCKTDTHLDNMTKSCFYCNDKMPDCLNCTNLMTCISCNSSKNLTVKKDNSGCECMQDYFIHEQKCQLCSEYVDYCVQCESTQSNVRCKQCNEGFIYNEGSNICECPEGSIIIQKRCQKQQQSLQTWIYIGAGIAVILLLSGLSKLVYNKLRRQARQQQPLLFHEEPQVGVVHQEQQVIVDEIRQRIDNLCQEIGIGEQLSDEQKARKKLIQSLRSKDSITIY